MEPGSREWAGVNASETDVYLLKKGIEQIAKWAEDRARLRRSLSLSVIESFRHRRWVVELGQS